MPRCQIQLHPSRTMSACLLLLHSSRQTGTFNPVNAMLHLDIKWCMQTAEAALNRQCCHLCSMPGPGWPQYVAIGNQHTVAVSCLYCPC